MGRIRVARVLVDVLGIAILGAVAAASAGGGASAVSGEFVAILHGTLHEKFVYKPSDPEVWQGTLELNIDEVERANIAPSGRVTHEKPYISLAGYVLDSYAPPNSSASCVGDF